MSQMHDAQINHLTRSIEDVRAAIARARECWQMQQQEHVRYTIQIAEQIAMIETLTTGLNPKSAVAGPLSDLKTELEAFEDMLFSPQDAVRVRSEVRRHANSAISQRSIAILEKLGTDAETLEKTLENYGRVRRRSTLVFTALISIVSTLGVCFAAGIYLTS